MATRALRIPGGRCSECGSPFFDHKTTILRAAATRPTGGTVQRAQPAHLEESLRAGASCVDNPLRYPLPVELRQFLQQMVVLQQNGAPLADRQGRVVVPDGLA